MWFKMNLLQRMKICVNAMLKVWSFISQYGFEEDKEILKEIKLAYPQKISEAEPLNIGG